MLRVWQTKAVLIVNCHGAAIAVRPRLSTFAENHRSEDGGCRPGRLIIIILTIIIMITKKRYYIEHIINIEKYNASKRTKIEVSKL